MTSKSPTGPTSVNANPVDQTEKTIFELGSQGRYATAQVPNAPEGGYRSSLPSSAVRESSPGLPEASELQVVRHFTRLSQKNFSIDTQFYPLGSCTMKYNPRACNQSAGLSQ